MTFGAALRVYGGVLCTFQARSLKHLGTISFFKAVFVCGQGGVGVGLVFQQGHVAFLKAFLGREPCGIIPFASGNWASPEIHT